MKYYQIVCFAILFVGTVAGSEISTTFTPDEGCPYPTNIITYYYYPGNCSKFYECYLGKKYLKECPAGLNWNHIANYCDYPENVDCSRTLSTTPIPSSTTANPICQGLPDGAFLSKADDCTKFFECLNGIAYLYTCPAGTEWSQSEKLCDYPSKANCQVTTPASK